MSLLAPGRNLVLIGLMGVGKSTVAPIVGARLGRPVVDTDAIIEAEAGKPVAQLFAELGERAFRAVESERVRHTAALRGQVVAVGGGAVLDSGNVTQLRSTGDLVLLDAVPATLAARVGEDASERPLLEGRDAEATLAALRRERDAVYAAAAAHAVDTTDRSPEQVADEVLDWAVHVPGLLSREERSELGRS